MDRTTHLSQIAIENNYTALESDIGPETLEIAHSFFTVGHQMPGGGALTQNPRMLRGFSGAYKGAIRSVFADLVGSFTYKKMALSLYGAVFVVTSCDAKKAAVELSAAGELCRRLAHPYLFFDANQLATMIRSNHKIKLDVGVGATLDVSATEALDYAGILHLTGYDNMNPYTQSICSGFISTMLNRGLFVILDGGDFDYVSKADMSDYIHHVGKDSTSTLETDDDEDREAWEEVEGFGDDDDDRGY